MAVVTGQTVFEDILSLDADNNPVSGATFDIVMTKNGAIYSGLTVDVNLIDASRGIFSMSWSASTEGDYQMYAKNNVTNVIFIANTVTVATSSGLQQTIYIGL
jgi:hypothetical protein